MESSYTSTAAEFIRSQVPDWNDDVISTARFKAFSGQRSDWEPKYQFWRGLILNTARHLRVFTIQPSLLKNVWFNRGGLSPLCLDHVLFLMYNEGDIMRITDLVDPTSARLTQIFRKARNLMGRSVSASDLMLEDRVFLTALLKDKADEVAKLLSESHWTSSCVVTMKKFQEACEGSDEASAVLSYLSGTGTARFLSISRRELIQGVKVSLSRAPVSAVSSLDRDVLHLVWTTEKLQEQIDVIDRRYEVSRKSALAALSSRNKKLALRHARELKLASESREKCISLLNRVEEVVTIIANAEATKKVSEAIQIGARAIKQNKLTVEEVELCLDELEDTIDLQKQVENALVTESTPSYVDIDEADIEEEFKKLELEVGNELQVPTPRICVGSTSGEADTSESAHSLSDALSNLKLGSASAGESKNQGSVVPTRCKDSKSTILEAA